MHIESTKWKKFALALSLIIILNVFFNVAIETFYKMPRYENYCAPTLYSEERADKASCEDAGGLWQANAGYPKEVGVSGYCDVTYTCNKTFTDVNSVYSRNVFVILTVLGALTIVAALFAKLPNAVSSGLLYGGVLSLIIGTIRFWSQMDDYLRFIVTGAVLVILIALGVKKMKD